MPTQTIGLTTENQVEVISAYTATNQQLRSVATTPGWYVVGSFYLPISSPARLEAIGLVSAAGITLRVRLFDLVACAPVDNSTVEIVAMKIDTRVVSESIDLIGKRLYQIQAEVVGAEGFGVVAAATLI